MDIGDCRRCSVSCDIPDSKFAGYRKKRVLVKG